VAIATPYYFYSRLRKKLSAIFNASVNSRREQAVNFRHKEGDFLSIIINFVFGILSMFHLAYLGVMFDQRDTQVSLVATGLLTFYNAER